MLQFMPKSFFSFNKYSHHITSLYFYTFTCLRIIANVNVHLKIKKNRKYLHLLTNTEAKCQFH